MKTQVKIILEQGFCPLKIKITQFPDGFRLNACDMQLPCTVWFLPREQKPPRINSHTILNLEKQM